jgi:hypothetical protein
MADERPGGDLTMGDAPGETVEFDGAHRDDAIRHEPLICVPQRLF